MIADVPTFESAAQRRKFETMIRTRELVPRAAFPAMVRLRSAVGRRRPGRREVALRNARMVLGEQAPQREVDALVERVLLHAAWRQEAYRKASMITPQEVVGAEHLREASARGKGVVVSLFHHGDYVGSMPSLARLGLPTESVSLSNAFRADAGTNLKAGIRAMTSEPGATLLDVADGSARIRERLALGKTVVVAVDLAGHTPARLFGRDLMLSSGALRVAHELGTPVVLMTSRRPRRPLRAGTTVLSAPLDPADHPDFASLHADVVRRLEVAALAWPEAMHQPDRLLSEGIVQPS